jgi:hypothetical protein
MANWTRRIAFLILALFSATPARAAVLKILELNFNSEIAAFDDRDSLMRDLRFKALIDYIRAEQPDVILVAEAWNFHKYANFVTPLAKAVDYDSFYRIDEGFPGLMYDGDAIMAKRSLRMSETERVILPGSAPHLGDEKKFIIPLGVISNAVGAKLTLPGGDSVLVYATHLVSSSEQTRAQDAAAIDHAAMVHATRDGIAWNQANVIIAGDFNSDPGTETGRTLPGLGYQDTWAEAHPDHIADPIACTNCANPYSPRFDLMTIAPGQFPAQSDMGGDDRIDYIAARGPSVKTLASTIVFTHPYNGFWMSDHYGVLSTVAIDEPNAAPVANPLTDSDGQTPAPTTVLEITDETFRPCHKRIDCEIKLPKQVVGGYKGFALVNKSSDSISAKITRGDKRDVLPARSTSLNAGQASAFYFAKSGEYRIRVIGPEGDVARARILAAPSTQ